jgi:pilus assembly protein Flp/PilA
MLGIYQQFVSRLFWNNEKGQDLVEYALLAGLVAVAAVLFLPGMSSGMGTIYSKLASKLVEASS